MSHVADAASDEQARRESLDPSRSILLQAPAGSGKTTILTQRFLVLLGLVAAPEEILAITFTRKAAAEMHGRITEALGWTESPADPSKALTFELAQRALARSQALGWQLQDMPSRLRIQTIDSLSHRLAASLPVGSRSGTALAVIEDARELYLQAARRALREAEADPALQAHSALLFERLGNDWLRLEDLIAQMLARRNHWLRHLADGTPDDIQGRVEASLRELADETVAHARRTLGAELLREGEEFLGIALQNLGLAPPGAGLERWRALARLALTDVGGSDVHVRRALNKNSGFPPKDPNKDRATQWLQQLAAHPDAEAALIDVAVLPDAVFRADERSALAAMTELLRFAAAQLALEFAGQGGLDYPAIAAAARQALVEDGYPTELALHHGSQLRHLLVDEFQDTSIEQFSLLEGLVRSWDRTDGRSLFLVGDPMQSIYQFREADVGLFLRARDSGIGGTPLHFLQLSRNFRSSPELVEWANGLFAGVFPRTESLREGSIAFLHSVAMRGAAPRSGAGVCLHRLMSGDAGLEARAVRQIVAATRRDNPSASIAVLVRARSHAAAITESLLADGFAVEGIDLVGLAEIAVVQDLVAVTRALLHAGDRTAWLALLRSPLCGLTLAELTELVAAEPDGLIVEAMRAWLARASGSTSMRQRLQRVMDAMDAAALMRGQRSCAQRVEAAWEALGGVDVYGDARDQRHAQRFLLTLDRLSEQGAEPALEELEGALEKLFAAATPAADAIQIMTIHKAKGLEFDCVILPGLGRSGARDSDPLLHWAEWPSSAGEPALLLAPIRAESASEPGALVQWLRGLRRRRSAHERARLAYVAVTRARQSLHLLAADPVSRPAHGSLLATLWPGLESAWSAATLPAPLPAADDRAGGSGIDLQAQGTAVQQWWRLADDWRPAPPAAVAAAQTLAVGRVLPAETPDFDWVSAIGRHVGTVVHAELQRIAQQSQLPGIELQPAARARIEALLSGEGVAAQSLPLAVERVELALARVAADARARWMLIEPQRDAHSEFALTGLYEGRVTQVIIDRSFIDAAGQRWVIDFKTSDHQGGGLDEFLRSEAQRYRAQLVRYAALATQLGPEPVRAALYFPLLSQWLEVPLESR